MSEKYLIVGLGNPQKKYFHTRHNFGFLVLEKFAQDCSFKWNKSSSVNGLIAEGIVAGQECIFLLPLTFVNLSGVAVKKLVDKKGISLNRVLVVCDDLSVEFGQMRLRPDGSHGGHNGLKSIIEQLGTKDFARLRLGIGRPHDSQEVVDYVLGEFTKEEKKLLPDVVSFASECIGSWLKSGTAKAMNEFNKKNLLDKK